MKIYPCEEERWEKEDRTSRRIVAIFATILTALVLWVFGIVMPIYGYLVTLILYLLFLKATP